MSNYFTDVTSWQSEKMKAALNENDPIKRLIDVFELLHPLRLSDPIHGFVDIPKLIIEARAETAKKQNQ